jgi:hypothetical protein
MCTQLAEPPSTRRAFSHRQKSQIKGARCARVAGAMALRATPDNDLSRQDLGTYQEDGRFDGCHSVVLNGRWKGRPACGRVRKRVMVIYFIKGAGNLFHRKHAVQQGGSHQ